MCKPPPPLSQRHSHAFCWYVSQTWQELTVSHHHWRLVETRGGATAAHVRVCCASCALARRWRRETSARSLKGGRAEALLWKDTHPHKHWTRTAVDTIHTRTLTQYTHNTHTQYTHTHTHTKSAAVSIAQCLWLVKARKTEEVIHSLSLFFLLSYPSVINRQWRRLQTAAPTPSPARSTLPRGSPRPFPRPLKRSAGSERGNQLRRRHVGRHTCGADSVCVCVCMCVCVCV